MTPAQEAKLDNVNAFAYRVENSTLPRLLTLLERVPAQVWEHALADLADPDEKPRSAGWQLQRVRRVTNRTHNRVSETFAALRGLVDDLTGKDRPS